jgi:hypothetical protein
VTVNNLYGSPIRFAGFQVDDELKLRRLLMLADLHFHNFLSLKFGSSSRKEEDPIAARIARIDRDRFWCSRLRSETSTSAFDDVELMRRFGSILSRSLLKKLLTTAEYGLMKASIFNPIDVRLISFC